jgi:Protein kinase domain
MPEALPRKIGPWRIEAEIGRGMMGVVYKGRDSRRRVAAVKVVRILFPISEDERLRFEKRFMQEGRIVARLSHEGIVGVYDVARDKKRVPYMALEFLGGRTLADMLSEGSVLAWRECLGLVAQVAEALHHAHGRGVIHRDIKPANIMVLPSGRAKLMDFGLAKSGAGAELTSTGQFMGTPLYMSPEQALGERLDARTDIFSLGSVAYTLLTGKRAFEGDSVPHVMNRVAHQTPPLPTKVSATLPPEVDYLLSRSMAKRRSDRYGTARMFAEDVTDVIEGRPPRHAVGWVAPVPGEGTVVAAREPGFQRHDEDPLELEPLDDDAPRGRAGSLLWLGLALSFLAAVLFRSPFWLDRIAGSLGVLPAPTPVAGPSSPTRAPRAPTVPTTMAAAVLRSPEPAEAGSSTPTSLGSAEDDSPTEDVIVDDEDEAPKASPGPSGEGPAAASTENPPSAAASVEPSASPGSASPSPAAPRAGALSSPPSPSTASHPAPSDARPMARFAITFEHGIQHGTLRVLVDRKVVLSQRLTSRVTKDLLLFKLRSGVVRDTLHVVPGRRRIRVEVRTPDDVRIKQTVATFRAGRTRRLDVKIGRLRGNLSLEWK